MQKLKDHLNSWKVYIGNTYNFKFYQLNIENPDKYPISARSPISGIFPEKWIDLYNEYRIKYTTDSTNKKISQVYSFYDTKFLILEN